MAENWQVDIAGSESDRKFGRVEVAAYTSIGFDRRTVATVERLEDARQIVADHNNAARATDRMAEMEALIERTIFALSLGGSGTLEEAERVQRDHGNQLANLYLDLCAAVGRGHRAALSGSSAVPDGGE
jgi:hypothetical protein